MNTDFKVAEVELSYKNTVPYKERKQVQDAYMASLLIRKTYSEGQIGYREYFKVLFLNQANQVLGCSTISEGGISATSVDVRLILQGALLTNASGIILAHNHPSGNLKPSTEDCKVTSQIQKAAKLLDMKVLDHIILSDEDYYSFCSEGLL